MLLEDLLGVGHLAHPVPDAVRIDHHGAAVGVLRDAGIRAHDDVGDTRRAQPLLVELVDGPADGLAAVQAAVAVGMVLGFRGEDALALLLGHGRHLRGLLVNGFGPVVGVFGGADEDVAHGFILGLRQA